MASPRSLCRKHGPAHTLTSDFSPPDCEIINSVVEATQFVGICHSSHRKLMLTTSLDFNADKAAPEAVAKSPGSAHSAARGRTQHSRTAAGLHASLNLTY